MGIYSYGQGVRARSRHQLFNSVPEYVIRISGETRNSISFLLPVLISTVAAMPQEAGRER